MVTNVTIEGFKCTCVGTIHSDTVTYMIYPEAAFLDEKWLQNLSAAHGVSIVVIYVPSEKWNDLLTPWPEPPEANGFPPFGGDASVFEGILNDVIIPQAETTCNLKGIKTRDLIGVSLSGLFTLWQWVKSDIFHSIGCLSGSFWYAGFLSWFERVALPVKKGNAYFLLGKQEPKARIKAYQCVGRNTEIIVEHLKKAGTMCEFEWVSGNHFSNPLERIEKAFSNLYGNTPSNTIISEH